MIELCYKGTMIIRISGPIYPATGRNFQEDVNLQLHLWDNFKSRDNISNSLNLWCEICNFIAINYYAMCL